MPSYAWRKRLAAVPGIACTLWTVGGGEGGRAENVVISLHFSTLSQQPIPRIPAPLPTTLSLALTVSFSFFLFLSLHAAVRGRRRSQALVCMRMFRKEKDIAACHSHLVCGVL